MIYPAQMKIKSLIELEGIIGRLRRRQPSTRVVWTNGWFDLLHVGHIRALYDAARQGSVLVVGVNQSGSKRPVNLAADRAEVVASLPYVDYVVGFDGDPIECIQTIQPDVCCKGMDYGQQDIPERRIVEGYGGVMHLTTYHEGYSSSSMKARCQ